MINKSKLMKRAWEIAKNGFYRTALMSIIGKAHFSEKFIRDICRYNLMNKKNFFEMAHVQKEMDIDFTIRDFFTEALKTAWAEVKKIEKAEFEKNLAEIENEHAEKREIERKEKIAKINENAPRRELIPAEKYEVGQKLYDFVITGLGREFRPDTDMFSLGITPDTEYVQYAYFN